MTSPSASRYNGRSMTRQSRVEAGLWIRLTASVVGRLVDLQWHATHDEFETASDQVRAPWLAWLGALVLLAVSTCRLARER
jgi:hypothetical protein